MKGEGLLPRSQELAVSPILSNIEPVHARHPTSLKINFNVIHVFVNAFNIRKLFSPDS